MRSAGLSLMLVFGLFGVWACCPAATKRSESLQSYLLREASSADSATAVTALLLLSHVRLTDNDRTLLVAAFDQETYRAKKLVLAYVLDSRFQLAEYQRAFVDLYPTGADQTLVWNMKTDYVAVPSPLQVYLSYLARSDDHALDRLISGVRYADGANAEALAAEIVELYHYRPERVKAALDKAGVNPAEVGLQ
jgi:hypothetical protein